MFSILPMCGRKSIGGCPGSVSWFGVLLDELQADLDIWLDYYNNERTHQGKMCCGCIPMETLEDGKQIWQEKFVA